MLYLYTYLDACGALDLNVNALTEALSFVPISSGTPRILGRSPDFPRCALWNAR